MATAVRVTKVWDDSDDKDGIRPSSVVVDLFADGQKVASQVVTAADDGSWTFEFSGLPRYASDGHEIAYAVEEADVPKGYEAKVSGSAGDGFTITNTHVPGKPTPGKPSSKGVVPRTGDDGPSSSGLAFAIAMSGAALLLAHAALRRRRS